jgi:uncharacterized protein (DUF924 family)
LSAANQRPGAGQSEPGWVGEVLRYWFDEVGETHWFDAHPELDAQIQARFLGLHRQLASGELPDLSTARVLLATVIVLDQFSRNLFRGTARAYAADPLARQFADKAVRDGYDLKLTIPERQFLYMPFQHSEDRADQARSVELFEKLGDKGWLKFARAHQSIIDRFGRFPHRNAILERPSSAEEIASLDEPMGSF